MQLNASRERRSTVEACVSEGSLAPEYLDEVSKFLMQNKEFANLIFTVVGTTVFEIYPL